MKEKRCVICGRVFVPNVGNQITCSKECQMEKERRQKKVWYEQNRKVPDGRTRGNDGRLYEHRGESRRLYWTGQMLSDLKRWFPTTRNAELAECLGVSARTMLRKARELGLEKDPEWLKGVWRQHIRIAVAKNRREGNSGMYKKGRPAPATSFKKGHRPSEESRRKSGEGIHRWAMANPTKSSERAKKAWETRRLRAIDHSPLTIDH